jgi:hypothetical protein
MILGEQNISVTASDATISEVLAQRVPFLQRVGTGDFSFSDSTLLACMPYLIWVSCLPVLNSDHLFAWVVLVAISIVFGEALSALIGFPISRSAPRDKLTHGLDDFTFLAGFLGAKRLRCFFGLHLIDSFTARGIAMIADPFEFSSSLSIACNPLLEACSITRLTLRLQAVSRGSIYPELTERFPNTAFAAPFAIIRRHLRPPLEAGCMALVLFTQRGAFSIVQRAEVNSCA